MELGKGSFLGLGKAGRGLQAPGFWLWGDKVKGLPHGKHLQGFPIKGRGTQVQPLSSDVESGVEKLIP